VKKYATIHFACNDHRDGSFGGKVAAAAFRDNDLESPGMSEVKFTAGEDFIRIHRRSFKIIGHSYWVGNWCWDAFRMTRGEAKQLLAHLRKSGWQHTGGEVHFGIWWDKGSAQ
jgi:hypothetical protein